jgi:hypothetical protein
MHQSCTGRLEGPGIPTPPELASAQPTIHLEIDQDTSLYTHGHFEWQGAHQFQVGQRYTLWTTGGRQDEIEITGTEPPIVRFVVVPG